MVDGRLLLAVEAGAFGDRPKEILCSPALNVKSPGTAVWRRFCGVTTTSLFPDGRVGYAAKVGFDGSALPTCSFGDGERDALLDGVVLSSLCARSYRAFVEELKSTCFCIVPA